MKKLLLFLILTRAARAQWIVHDPVNTAVNTAIQAGQAANQVEILRQWAANLDQLNRQLGQLQAQLIEQRGIRQTMGDPAAAGGRVSLTDLAPGDFTRSYAETASALRSLARAVDSLKNTAQGIFEELDDRTVLNQPFARQTAPYQRYAVVEQHARNLDAVFSGTDARLAVLRGDLGDTVQQLKAAPVFEDNEKTMAALHARIAGCRAVLDAVGEKDLEGWAAKKVSPPWMGGKWVRGDHYLHQLAIPNFHFHVVTAYSILRHNGVPLGKSDYIGGLPMND